MKSFRIILALAFVLSTQVEAGVPVYFSPLTLQATGDWQFKNSYTLHSGFHAQIFKNWALGIRYSQWLGDSQFAWGGQSSTDRLTLQTLGPELGYRWGNPRMHYFLSVGASVPVKLEVVQAGGSNKSFSASSSPVLFEGRFQIQLKFIQNISWILEAGYRWVDLGDLKSGSESYLASGTRLKLSAPFFGTGIGIHF